MLDCPLFIPRDFPGCQQRKEAPQHCRCRINTIRPLAKEGRILRAGCPKDCIGLRRVRFEKNTAHFGPCSGRCDRGRLAGPGIRIQNLIKSDQQQNIPRCCGRGRPHSGVWAKRPQDAPLAENASFLSACQPLPSPIEYRHGRSYGSMT